VSRRGKYIHIPTNTDYWIYLIPKVGSESRRRKFHYIPKNTDLWTYQRRDQALMSWDQV
jgi:hypothetical protein